MKVHADFEPKNLEKAIDLARHIATFAHFEFTPGFIRLRCTDPAKVVHFDMILTPEIYKSDGDFKFGINLQMFYKLLKTLNNEIPVELDADESVLKLNQTVHHHTLINQDVPFNPPAILDFTGPKVLLPTKLFQRYVRALGNIAPAIELNYVPHASTLFLESVNSMYRTLFSMDTSNSYNEGEEYRSTFMVKFLEMAINPSLADKIEVTLGDSLMVLYENGTYLSTIVTVAAYTDA